MADTLDEAQQLVEAALAELRAEDIEATGEVLPRTGSRGAQIVEVARKKQAALIVVGSHGGGSRLHKMVSGGVAEKVIGLADCSVLLVR